MGTSGAKEVVYMFGFGFHLNPFGMGPVGPKGPTGGRRRTACEQQAGGGPANFKCKTNGVYV